MSNRDGWKRDLENAPMYLPARAIRAKGRRATMAERSNASDPRRDYVKGGVRRGI